MFFILITEEVEITLSSMMIKYYEELGYEIPRSLDKRGRITVSKGTKITVNIKHLPNGSIFDVIVKCDYCGKIYNRKYIDFCKTKKGIIKEDACDSCRMVKIQQVNMIKYGVKSPIKLPEIKEKIKDIFINKYGTNSLLSVPEIRDKFLNTNIERYGVSYPMRNEENKQK